MNISRKINNNTRSVKSNTESIKPLFDIKTLEFYCRYVISMNQNISIYNLNVASGVNATDYMLSLKGKTNLEEDLDKAITCTKAFPRNDENDSLRRQWQSMYSLNHKYI